MKLRRAMEMERLHELPLDCVHAFIVSQVGAGMTLQDLIHVSPGPERETLRKVNELLTLGVLASDDAMGLHFLLDEEVADDAPTIPPRRRVVTFERH